MSERVWIDKHELRNGKTGYYLRWRCPVELIRKSRPAGTNARLAQEEAALLRRELRDGTYKGVKRTAWQTFVDDHCEKIPGLKHRSEARQVLTEFGRMCGPATVAKVTYSMVESYIAKLRKRGNRPPTLNKKARYLKGALAKAVKRKVAAVNVMDGWCWEPEELPVIRVVSQDEEKHLLDAATEIYGQQWRTFIHTALATGARRGELLGLQWSDVNLADGSLTFRHTKTRRDRTVPIADDTVAALRRLQPATLQIGGPFRDMVDNIYRRWRRIRKQAGCLDVTIHNLRDTCATRLFERQTSPKVVMKLLGHTNLSTTLKHYVEVTDDDLRDAVRRLSAG